MKKVSPSARRKVRDIVIEMINVYTPEFPPCKYENLDEEGKATADQITDFTVRIFEALSGR